MDAQKTASTEALATRLEIRTLDPDDTEPFLMPVHDPDALCRVSAAIRAHPDWSGEMVIGFRLSTPSRSGDRCLTAITAPHHESTLVVGTTGIGKTSYAQAITDLIGPDTAISLLSCGSMIRRSAGLGAPGLNPLRARNAHSRRGLTRLVMETLAGTTVDNPFMAEIAIEAIIERSTKDPDATIPSILHDMQRTAPANDATHEARIGQRMLALAGLQFESALSVPEFRTMIGADRFDPESDDDICLAIKHAQGSREQALAASLVLAGAVHQGASGAKRGRMIVSDEGFSPSLTSSKMIATSRKHVEHILLLAHPGEERRRMSASRELAIAGRITSAQGQAQLELCQVHATDTRDACSRLRIEREGIPSAFLVSNGRIDIATPAPGQASTPTASGNGGLLQALRQAARAHHDAALAAYAQNPVTQSRPKLAASYDAIARREGARDWKTLLASIEASADRN